MKPLGRLLPFLRPYRLQVLLSLIFTFCLTGVILVVPYIIREVIDVGLGKAEPQILIGAAILLFVIGILRSGLMYIQRYTSEWVAAHIGYDLRNRMYDHIQYLSFSYHDHTQTGQIISRVIEDVRSVERFTGLGLVEMIRVLFLLIGISVILLVTQPKLAALTLIPVLVLMMITSNFGGKIGSYFMDVDISLGELSARLQENVNGVQVVRAFAREMYEIKRFNDFNRILYNARVRVISAFSRVMPTAHFLVSLCTVIILWFGGGMVLRGEMTIGEVVAFNSYLLLLSMPARQLVWLVNLAGEAVAGLRRNFEILDLVPEIHSPEQALELANLSGSVEFCNVCFNYEGQKIPALDQIDLEIEPNQIIALIGPTGSGKTSLVNLIPRFYDVSQGAVLLDGVDVRQMDLVSLRRQIGIVLQTSLLFSMTIAENIAYGRPDASQGEIESAARSAQAHEFIMRLPEGYQTIVGEKGFTLSGGERQRIAIARALLLDPRILILDDSTSSVDTETERLIQQALDRLMIGRTTFVIAHRLSTVQRADLILVLKDGHIVERGKHEQLLQMEGIYREIYDLQLLNQEQFREDMEELDLKLAMGMRQRSQRKMDM